MFLMLVYLLHSIHGVSLYLTCFRQTQTIYFARWVVCCTDDKWREMWCRNSLSAHTSDGESLECRSLHTSAHTRTQQSTHTQAHIYTFAVFLFPFLARSTFLYLKKSFWNIFKHSNSWNNMIDVKTRRGIPKCPDFTLIDQMLRSSF